ncbi:unnamed protein product [Blepharisma stoltei]|uniref:USP domain-containing protein n=1 Tax=Blepharisma stoltei TaxID=1481888 RepID=A0AAU9INR9_9CILI|nr:unnamed protein product [Blepharisma stoltei]
MQQEEKEGERSQNRSFKFYLYLLYILSQLGSYCSLIYGAIARYCEGICDFIIWLICCKIRDHKKFEWDNQIENPNYFSQEEIVNYPGIKENYSRKLGIPNFGNTCYLNSVLQILASTPEFSKCLNPDFELSGTLLTIIKMINKYSDTNFQPEINSLLKIIQQSYSDFTLGRQNDSKEIFVIIIDKCSEINENLKDLFFIRKDETIICENGHIEKKEEVETLLLIPQNFNKDISGFIDILEQKSDFSGENKLYCSTCNSLKDASITSKYKLPKFLVFYFPGENPKKRNIKESETFKDKEYELYGIISFYPSYRHYIAFTLDGGIWREYNDISVTEKKPDYYYTYMAFYRHAEKL